MPRPRSTGAQQHIRNCPNGGERQTPRYAGVPPWLRGQATGTVTSGGVGRVGGQPVAIACRMKCCRLGASSCGHPFCMSPDLAEDGSPPVLAQVLRAGPNATPARPAGSHAPRPSWRAIASRAVHRPAIVVREVRPSRASAYPYGSLGDRERPPAWILPGASMSDCAHFLSAQDESVFSGGVMVP